MMLLIALDVPSRRAEAAESPDCQGHGAQCAQCTQHGCDRAARAGATRRFLAKLAADQRIRRVFVIPFDDESKVVRTLESGVVLAEVGGLHAGWVEQPMCRCAGFTLTGLGACSRGMSQSERRIQRIAVGLAAIA